MKKLLYALIYLLLFTGLALSQSYDLQFIEETNDMTVGGDFDVRGQHYRTLAL